jgi:hypothetical protein
MSHGLKVIRVFELWGQVEARLGQVKTWHNYRIRCLKYFLFVFSKIRTTRVMSTVEAAQTPPRILRKLGGSERFYVNTMDKHCNFLNSRCFLIESKIDLYERIGLLNRAIKHWQKYHPFLNSHVIRNTDDNDLYFAYYAAQTPNNVTFLTFENPNGYKDFWQPIFEREFQVSIDSYGGLLWRLMIIQDKPSSCTNNHNNKFNYCLVFTANHAIIDGRNAFCIISQLVNIIERVYLNLPLGLDVEYTVLPPHHLHDHVQKHGVLHTSHGPHQTFKLPDGFRYCDQKQPMDRGQYNNSGTFLRHVDQDHVVFHTHMSDILADNQAGFTDIVYLRFDSTVIERLLDVCKMNGTKLTGCMNIIAVSAVQKLLLKYGGPDSAISPIRFGFTVDNRQFMVPRIDPYRMGYCSLLFDRVVAEKTVDVDFWTLVRRESDLIHERLKAGENIHLARNDDHFGFPAIAPDTTYFHFVIANRGNMTDYSNTDANMLKIREHFNSMSFGPNTGPNLFFISLDSIDKNMTLAFSYNNRIVSRDAAWFLRDSIRAIVVNLSNSKETKKNYFPFNQSLETNTDR